MFAKLLPERADNSYRGRKAALAILGLVLLMKAAISLGSMFNGRNAATSADGIPIDSYTPAGAQTVLSLFAVLGLANLMVCIVGIVVLARYRSLVPFILTLLLTQQLGRQLILTFLPIARVGAPPGFGINLGLLGLMLVGLVLSLWRRPAGAG